MHLQCTNLGSVPSGPVFAQATKSSTWRLCSWSLLMSLSQARGGTWVSQRSLVISFTNQSGRKVYSESRWIVNVTSLCGSHENKYTNLEERSDLFFKYYVLRMAQRVYWQIVNILTLDHLLWQFFSRRTESHCRSSCKLLASNSYIPSASSERQTLLHMCIWNMSVEKTPSFHSRKNALHLLVNVDLISRRLEND